MIQLYDTGSICGYDYEGCPVLFTLIGTLDPKGLLMSVSKQELIRGHLKIYEQLSQECEMQSQKVSDWEVRGTMVGEC